MAAPDPERLRPTFPPELGLVQPIIYRWPYLVGGECDGQGPIPTWDAAMRSATFAPDGERLDHYYTERKLTVGPTKVALRVLVANELDDAQAIAAVWMRLLEKAGAERTR